MPQYKLHKTAFLIFCLISLALTASISMGSNALALEKKKENNKKDDSYEPYLKLLKEVYETMDKHYFIPVSSQAYESFVKKYTQSILSKLKPHTQRIDMVAFRGAGLLVNTLKSPDDKFTNFIPPQIAQEYSQEIYGKRQDIGITGNLARDGFLIDHVQIRSDSYEKGIRDNDIIIEINGTAVKDFDEETITILLAPELDSTVLLRVFSPQNDVTQAYEILSKEYFKETVQIIPTYTEHIYCLKIERFNRKTADDLKDYIAVFNPAGIECLILDLRDNPGGPPLAVHELSGIFLPADSKLFYYKKKGIAEFGLTTPVSTLSYDGPLVILINKNSGSSSELLTGTFKAYKRAVIVGTEPTAGSAFLKSTFTFEDKSMLAMVTGIAYLFNGTPFGLEGVEPNIYISDKIDNIIEFVVEEFKKETLL